MLPLVRDLVPPPDPTRCCELLEGLPYRLFLDSVTRGRRLCRYSFLTADPVAVLRCKGSRTECIGRLGDSPRVTGRSVLDVVRELLEREAAEPIQWLPPFQGGAAGYFAYEWGRESDGLGAVSYDDQCLPDSVIGVYDWVLAWDHETSAAWLLSTGLSETTVAGRARRAAKRAAAILRRLESERPSSKGDSRAIARERLRPGPPAPSHPLDVGGYSSHPALRSSFTRTGYLDAVARVREYILAGDIFQANLSQRFEAPLTEPPWALYLRLRALNPAPFAAYLDFPEAVVLSASPERFLQVDPHGHVETRPIKGTRARGHGPEHDAALGLALVESEKDRAENLMIVDLMRNDLSRVCAPGTVRVPELFALEGYATVHHLVSTVVGELTPGVDALELLRVAFPGGSITGAPKFRAMEIIAELEPSCRGIYCGSIGYWSVTGALDTNIAIRTAVVVDDRVYFGAGGGIVADSDPEQEYRETLDKARGIINALAQPA